MKHSTGPSGKNGGDLGWFSPKSMVKPFSEALIGMEKGGYTHQPVKTQFGWHVIMMEDSRESTPPAFEQVKPQLEMMVRNQRVQDYINKLRNLANIQIMETEPAPEAETEGAAATAPATTAEPASTDEDAEKSSSTDTAASSEPAPAEDAAATTEDAPKAE